VIDQELEVAIAWQRANPGPPLGSIPIAAARTNYAEAAALLDPSPPAGVTIDEMVLPGPAGGIPARRYTPPATAASGVLLWAHGGGWVLGGLDSHDHACRRLAVACGQQVLAMDYRLAPEHPFPAGQDDVTAAVRWALAAEDALGTSSIAVGGDSAGAMLALVAALEVGEGLSCLALCYPPLGPGIMTDSRRAFADGWGLSNDDMAFFYDLLLEDDQDRSDPRVSPLLTMAAATAPPTVVSVAGFDVLHDEGMALVGLLEGAGVRVELLDEVALTHGYLRLGGISGGARTAIDRFGGAVRTMMEDRS